MPGQDDSEMIEHAHTLGNELLGLDVISTAPLILRPVVGIAPFQLGHTGVTDVLRSAHGASLDALKAEQAVGTYSPARDASHRRSFTLIGDFCQALAAKDQLELAYQPRIAAASGQCVGVEALIRWRHPTLRAISPAEIIPLIENTVLSRELTDWVIRTAIRQAGQWYRLDLGLRVSLNIAQYRRPQPGRRGLHNTIAGLPGPRAASGQRYRTGADRERADQ